MELKLLILISFEAALLGACLSQTCEKILETTGEISHSSSAGSTTCWSIEVPENSYARLEVTSLNFQGVSCDYVSLKIEVAATEETYTYCSRLTNAKPITALNDVKITFHRTYHYDRYDMSFRLKFITENLICVQADHFKCSPNKCVHTYQVCDGVKDCENGADEVGCGTGVLAVKGIEESLEHAVAWLKKQRSSSLGWGKNTHRAITSLFLAKEVTGHDLEDELMVKELEVQTLFALLRNSTSPISVSQLSMFVNALQVTCHKPREFYGHDLVQILGERASVPHPSSASAYLTLCNTNWTFTESDVTRLFKFLHKSSKYPFISDVQAVAIMAISCLKKQDHHLESIDSESLYDEIIKKFIDSQLPDGSFGNVYTTALVTQALISSEQEDNEHWDVRATVHYLMKQLNSSSVDFLSTYLTLPIFNGRSLADISAVNCSNIEGDDSDISDITNKGGPKMRVQYSLFVGDERDVIHTMVLSVPENTTAYDVMRVAQVTDPKYKFLRRDVSGQIYVYDIAGIPNDPEAGMFWLLYLENRDENEAFKHYTESPDNLVLEDEEHLIMWYKTAEI